MPMFADVELPMPMPMPMLVADVKSRIFVNFFVKFKGKIYKKVDILTESKK